ncbi:hypothetical protein BD779DRAFT_1468676 [Infundibulicybe gibba]|nr:hypothetical protein BD779DRAFT_1468676 [Infundibulicybe gibba]
MATYRTSPTVPPDMITYRLGNKLVFVKPADDYEAALDIAQKEFPEDLSQISRDRISFYILATMEGQKRAIRVSESAWPAASAGLRRTEIIDILVRPNVKEAPPQYLEVPQSKEGSLPLSSEKIFPHSAPSSQAGSRAPSPSGRASPRSWFGKF